MKLVDLFDQAISNSNTHFFIIDSGYYEKDDDFVSYAWHRKRNNKIRAGDVFIYRKPQKLSNNGQFYFYGAGEFATVEGENAVTGRITNQHPFKNPIFQTDIEDFQWEWKKRDKGWEYYWNQYGINQITKSDFTNVLLLLDEDSYDNEEDKEVVKYNAQIAEGNFYVEDKVASVRVRAWQRAWSDRVKGNYGYVCAMCDVASPDFLIGSHIAPVSENKENRMNPSNGICLCVLHDQAFDKGYLAVDDSKQIVFSSQLDKGEHKVLKRLITSGIRKTLRKPQRDIPLDVLLKYHRLSIFRLE